MSDLPEFDERPYEWVYKFARYVLSHGKDSSLIRLEAFDDGHYRAVFRKDYFILGEDRTEPSKSQWNTLKKRIKRINRDVFIFKQHGETADGHYYMDFGFFQD
ncbi:MAG: hypothetical protein ACOCYT_04425 [Chloroflexota bacterium]